MSRWITAWDRPQVDLPLLVELVVGEAGARPLATLLASLPQGLVHAEAIAIVPHPPSGFRPLSAESAWWSAGRSLAVVTTAPETVLVELAELAWWWARVRQRVRPGDPSDEAQRLAWSMDLELETATVAWLDAYDRWAEIAEAARFPFAPVMRVDVGLRPGARKSAGARAGERWARRSAGALPVLAAASPVALDTFSPYVRDLGHALHAWASENPDRIHDPDLMRWAAAGPGQPDPAAGAIVAAALGDDEDLRAERRRAERSQGLEVEDDGGLVVGTAHLEHLDAPHPRLEGGQGTLGLFIGRDGLALEGALEVVIDAGLASSLALLGRSGSDRGDLLLPAALVGLDDGYALPSRDVLAARAEAWSIPMHRSDLLNISGTDHPSSWVARILGKIRRSMVLGNLGSEVLVTAAFVRSDPAVPVESLRAARDVLGATAVLVGEMFGFSLSERGLSGLHRVSADKNRPSKRRFRV
ncbi:MAG: hypothetical protein AAFZ18_17525 [Myxococcota bacterium]